MGGYFSVAWPKAHGETLHLTAWRGEQVIAETRLKLSYLGPVWLDAEFRDIDKLRLSTEHHWQFVTDDMTFRLAQSPANDG